MRRYSPIAPSRGTRRPLCPVCLERPAGRQQKTCSARCGYELRKRTVKPRPCLHCGASFRPYPSSLARGAKYCSLACYRVAASVRPAMIDVSCMNCGATVRRTQAAIRRVRLSFCGNECRTKYLVGERHQSWRGGHEPNRGPGWRALAETIRERDGHACRRCGKSQAENGQRLSVDHIIPWRSFDSADEANRPSNLVALCRPCHSRKSRAERLWLKGDVLDMWQYQIAVSEPWGAS